MDNPLEKMMRQGNREKIEEPSELHEEEQKSITTGRLEELAADIKKMSVIPPISDEYFLNKEAVELDAELSEFVAAENRLDSNSKKKLYRRLKQEVLDEKIKEFQTHAHGTVNEIAEKVRLATRPALSSDEEMQLEIYLGKAPAWQRLKAVESLEEVFKKVGFVDPQLQEKIKEIEKMIGKDDYRTQEAKLGGYD
ncbi:hypothetical protein KGO95_01630 [Patescibacteria group bacterium]|nr:hypothetical protein [Patescibacteria group bacterium]